MPTVSTELATEAADWAGYDGFLPDACLINRYEPYGEAHEVKGYDALMRLHEADPSKLLSDKGYDSDEIRRDLIDRGIEPVIPP
jgi:Transposase DDE domain